MSISNSNLTLTPVAATDSLVTITVTATDPGGLSVSHTFSAKVESNSAPTPVGSMPDQSIKLGGSTRSIEVDGYFQDIDDDVLIFTAASNDTAIATVTVTAPVTVNITAVGLGSTTITVTATDPNGASGTQDLAVTVMATNRAPTAQGTIPNDTQMVGGSPGQRDASLYFNDADGDSLTFTATSSDTTIATVTMEGEHSEVVTVTSVAAGTVTITVTATDSENESATQTFTITVIPSNNPPRPVGTISSLPSQYLMVNGTATLNLANLFTDPDGDTLTYTASSADTSKATVSISGATLTVTAVAAGSTTITARATDPGTLGSKLDGSVTVRASNNAPTASTISDQTVNANQTATINLADYFSDPDEDALTYTASSSDTAKATASVSGATLTVNSLAAGTATITITATDTFGSSTNLSFTLTINAANTADAVPGISSQELSQLGALLTYDTVIFNELHNGSDDASDWLELRNVSGTAISLDTWQLNIRTSNGTVGVSFPTGTVIPAGDVLLLTNTEMATADASVLSVVVETFALPQTDFALILRSATAFGDVAGNYVQGEPPLPETLPALTVDTVWGPACNRLSLAIVRRRGERARTEMDLGSPGYQPSALTGRF